MSIQFSDTATKNGLIQECESMLFGDDYGAISGSTKKLATFTRNINEGLNILETTIMDCDTRWQFHDTNFTTLPIGKANLVAGQQDYDLPDVVAKLNHIYAKDQNGSDQPLKPLDEYDLNKGGVAPTEFLKTDGMPEYYDLKGDSIFLYPAPAANSVTLTDGLVLAYQSTPSYFVAGDTTKAAGVITNFQMFPAVYAAFIYAENNEMPKKAAKFEKRVDKMLALVQTHYSKSNKDDKGGLKARKKNYV